MAVIDGKPATDFSDMNRKYIHDVAEEAASSGGGGLPDITESDIGKVLTAGADGAEWSDVGGGDENNIFYIEVSDIDSENHTFTVSTSVEDIADAFESGKHCFLHYLTRYYPVSGYEGEEGYVSFTASLVTVYEGDISYETFDYENDGEDVVAVYTNGTKQW